VFTFSDQILVIVSISQCFLSGTTDIQNLAIKFFIDHNKSIMINNVINHSLPQSWNNKEATTKNDA